MSSSEEGVRVKRQKTSNDNMDPRSNPYLAHMYEGEKSGADMSVFSRFKRHATTAEDARVAEDGPNNPFTGKRLSKRYFDILKTRRNLPVHSQR
jgi:pre-mRNA-splicing factor ATP-dependent RNA helicase DHX15/PRP43